MAEEQVVTLDTPVVVPLDVAITALDALLYTHPRSHLWEELKAAKKLADTLGDRCPKHLSDQVTKYVRASGRDISDL